MAADTAVALAVVLAAPPAGLAIARVAAHFDADSATMPGSFRRSVPVLAALALAGWAILACEGGEIVLAAGLGWTLLALALIDWRVGLLPDALTVPLAAAGLAWAAYRDQAVPGAEIAGAVAGWALFAAIGALYRRLRGQEGLGRGDAKLMAAAGAWVGATALPALLLVGCLTALAAAGASALRRARQPARDQPIAFGPHLCFATWLVWLYGPPAIY